ncbi:MAG: hypothetical protein LBP62_07400 [Clostridiales bacterium]|nr:hypothetical protein [Clostridiales bacterium]
MRIIIRPPRRFDPLWGIVEKSFRLFSASYGGELRIIIMLPHPCPSRGGELMLQANVC